MLKNQILGAVKQAKLALQDLAVDATITSRSPNQYVPGQPATYTETVTSTKAVLTTYESKEINGTTILSTDVRALIFVGDAVPAVNDLMTIDSKNYRVMDCKPIMVGLQVTVSDVQLRTS